MKHLLSAGDLDAGSALQILDSAEQMDAIQNRVVKKLPALRGRTVVNLFFEDSTRTRSSFEIAGKWLSADVINVSAKGSSVSKGESLRDTALTVAALGVDALVVRHPASGAVSRITEWVDCPVINAGDGTHEHPTQALLDAFSLRRRLGELAGRHVVIVGDLTHSRVARSNVLLLRTLGAEVTLVAPPTLMPSGVGTWNCSTSWDLDAALSGKVAGDVDAVMMLRVQRERMGGGSAGDGRPNVGYFPTEREYAIGYGLSPARLTLLPAHTPVLHPGPMNRGLEISSAAADSDRSLVLDQVRAGVAVRMAVLYHLLAGAEAPATGLAEVAPTTEAVREARTA
ncbi:aspartate carbamoyltransferase catalytic subunit [Jatrophihabitans lederbergiae]|uniref:Aspartate carbamoyltransferase n=1 Tax=Jatrophihabitans lederbergiae TaxID=3075547 RepID=A0ABU2J4T5_9ACTN|nr:aspartate carbamoyltransferase catalytic subunit [Jatrophihabitans sp. DSM 44399]MDT0259994.1 aspartate carbamoyltransferase catalytic subunit [Jatrophihabitans sp. DSM 44399]